ncbi:MAG: HPr kinase/phosphatase C-terminal domain-containing protein [Xanthobacteraceae bacterium]
MSTAEGATVHASCVLVGRSAVLIRGPSGSGKSQLALALIEASGNGLLPPARLVADDRVRLFAANGRLLAAAPEPLRGKIEIRGIGVRQVVCEPLALVGLVVDLAAEDAGRMPECAARSVEISGVKLSRLPIALGVSALAPVLAAVSTVTRA